MMYGDTEGYCWVMVNTCYIIQSGNSEWEWIDDHPPIWICNPIWSSWGIFFRQKYHLVIKHDWKNIPLSSIMFPFESVSFFGNYPPGHVWHNLAISGATYPENFDESSFVGSSWTVAATDYMASQLRLIMAYPCLNPFIGVDLQQPQTSHLLLGPRPLARNSSMAIASIEWLQEPFTWDKRPKAELDGKKTSVTLHVVGKLFAPTGFPFRNMDTTPWRWFGA
jgi:hypothetical protein